MKSAIILCSGGLDSVTVAFSAQKSRKYDEMIVLFFDYGQKSLNVEEICSKKCAKKIGARFVKIGLGYLGKISKSLINSGEEHKLVKIRDLKDTSEESAAFYVPCRNLLFISNAMSFAEALGKGSYDIIVGFKNEGGEGYPDTSQEFVKKLGEVGRVSMKVKCNILAPLIKRDKEDIVLLAQKLGVKFRETFSCYVGGDAHCGTCLACRLRQEGFYWANVKDPTFYEKKLKDFRKA